MSRIVKPKPVHSLREFLAARVTLRPLPEMNRTPSHCLLVATVASISAKTILASASDLLGLRTHRSNLLVAALETGEAFLIDHRLLVCWGRLRLKPFLVEQQPTVGIKMQGALCADSAMILRGNKGTSGLVWTPACSSSATNQCEE